MGAMHCAITALQHHIAEMVVHPELSQLLHDASPVLGRICVVNLYSSHGAASTRVLYEVVGPGQPELPTGGTKEIKCSETFILCFCE